MPRPTPVERWLAWGTRWLDSARRDCRSSWLLWSPTIFSFLVTTHLSAKQRAGILPTTLGAPRPTAKPAIRLFWQGSTQGSSLAERILGWPSTQRDELAPFPAIMVMGILAPQLTTPDVGARPSGHDRVALAPLRTS